MVAQREEAKFTTVRWRDADLHLLEVNLRLGDAVNDSCLGRENALDVFSQKTIQRAIFSEPKTWEQRVTIHAGDTALVNFVISEK
jgi:hypothetical protein